MASNASSGATDIPEPIPVYRIDLSLPPAERYTHLATDFAPKMRKITPLFDEVLAIAFPWVWLRRFIEWLSTFLLRRVHSSEETQELRGIARASGVSMYVLVAMNVLLDSLMGCTSGGALTKPSSWDGSTPNPRMMHFRTLDWGMDELRSVLVVLEFVKSKSEMPEKIIARSITYAGFVGVLTGVTQDLSISINVRPTHHCSTFKLLVHQILVLFGFRPSIVSILRERFIPSLGAPLPFSDLAKSLADSRSAPCYLILCSGTNTIVIEKDHLDGKLSSSPEFIVHTNHDIKDIGAAQDTHHQKEKSSVLGMEAFLEESEERYDCIQKKWNSLVKRREKKWNETRDKSEIKEGEEFKPPTVVREKSLKGWVSAYPIMNECSHFGCIMDPETGTIRWIERGVLEDNVDGNAFQVLDHE